MADVLQVEKREKVGSAATRRLRRGGLVPAVLYGHGEANEHLSVPVKQVQTMLRHHSKTVTLEGAVKETALVNHVHYDPLGIEVLHLDLIRVNLKEEVEVAVPLHTKGQSRGVLSGGVLLENLHEVEIKCSAGNIPESLVIDVEELDLGQSMTASQIDLPAGVSLVTDADAVVVHVEKPRGAAAETDETAASEPEVIAKGGADDDEA
ncbi:50S ribosomal protein L25 [Rubripirellula amarantea]|uniref:Large ribosomal subunit protein bL25 n=1 Tax=Rubripirellula amarantea TaxID=2527999 RepID=A0A5C5WH56_9BACT|nr:50S ribosomal protein L25 [Rubripirellula amarantea]MDA8743174.1 50S ribosomal protein L25 [Rubripirellula amarantea]TWT49439.1 General stress protein CTC [Rubripirellula amarantea]